MRSRFFGAVVETIRRLFCSTFKSVSSVRTTPGFILKFIFSSTIVMNRRNYIFLDLSCKDSTFADISSCWNLIFIKRTNGQYLIRFVYFNQVTGTAITETACNISGLVIYCVSICELILVVLLILDSVHLLIVIEFRKLLTTSNLVLMFKNTLLIVVDFSALS